MASRTASGTVANVDLELAHWTNASAAMVTKSISVIDPSQLPEYPDLPGGTSIDQRREHGLFSVSLIDAVAPAATIEAVRVADDAGHGDLPSLVGGLHWYLLERGTWDASGSIDVMTDTVFHIGVGSRDPTDSAVVGSANEVPTAMATLSAAAATMAAAVTDTTRKAYLEAYATSMASGAGTDLAALRAPITLAERVGAVIVAPAGNGNLTTPGPTAEVPANYAEVLGVLAVEKAGATGAEKSCFSGKLDGTTGITPGVGIAAPGGSTSTSSRSPPTHSRAVQLYLHHPTANPPNSPARYTGTRAEMRVPVSS